MSTSPIPFTLELANETSRHIHIKRIDIIPPEVTGKPIPTVRVVISDKPESQPFAPVKSKGRYLPDPALEVLEDRIRGRRG